jgi:methyl-accepting chemotaxis protein
MLSRAGTRARVLAIIGAGWSPLLAGMDLLLTRLGVGTLGPDVPASALVLPRLAVVLLPLAAAALPLLLRGKAMVHACFVVAVLYAVGNEALFYSNGLAGTPYQLMVIFTSIITSPSMLTVGQRGRVLFYGLFFAAHLALEAASPAPLAQKVAFNATAVLGASALLYMVSNLSRSHQVQYTLRADMQRTLQELEASRARVLEAGGTLAGSAGALAQTTEALSQQAAHLREEAGRIAGASGGVADSARELSVHSRQSAAATESAQQATRDVDALVGGMETGMADIERAVQEATASVRALQERAVRIGGSAGAVKELAAETNMLALNAGIEAMRAGEHGRGFGVVAREVRRLAEEASRSAAQVSDGVAGVTAQMREVLRTVEGIHATTARSAPVFESARRMLGAIRATVVGTQEALGRSAEEADRQAERTADISTATARLLELVEGHARTSVAVAATGQQLDALSGQLRLLLPEGGAPAPGAAGAPAPGAAAQSTSMSTSKS